MNKGISRLNRNFDDYKKALIELSKTYYPDMATTFDDASVASWLIDLIASVADNESYHIDRAYQETNIDDAQERSSLLAIARNNGVKIPGPKGSMAEIELSCILPTNGTGPDFSDCPVIKKGSVFASATQKFELLYDVDFESQFDYYNETDRTITPYGESQYKVTKRAVVVAGETLVEKFYIAKGDAVPFMELIIPNEKVMNVESIIEVESNDDIVNPSYEDFYSDCSENGLTRYYEVDSFIQDSVWTDKLDETTNLPITYSVYPQSEEVYTRVTRGEWKPVDHKFITEYTDKGYLRIIFGAGTGNENVSLGDNMADFSKWQISRILNNKNLGVLPQEGHYIYVLYRSGGGSASNVAAGAINKIAKLNYNGKYSNVLGTIKVTNTTPSVSGKDAPSEAELRYLIKYHNAAQERCVTTKDYIDRILQMPPKYGTPFRVGVQEVNNKIMIDLIGMDNNGYLNSDIPLAIAKNIENYLSKYRMVNDFVEIKAGRIINLSFEVEVYYDKAYKEEELESLIKSKITKFMDVRNHSMGENLYMSDLEKEIWMINGVKNIISFKIKNEKDVERGYSECAVGQKVDENDYIDLDYSNRTIFCSSDSMLELKYPDNDIKIILHEI